MPHLNIQRRNCRDFQEIAQVMRGFRSLPGRPYCLPSHVNITHVSHACH